MDNINTRYLTNLPQGCKTVGCRLILERNLDKIDQYTNIKLG